MKGLIQKDAMVEFKEAKIYPEVLKCEAQEHVNAQWLEGVLHRHFHGYIKG